MTGSLVVLAFLLASAPHAPDSVESLLKEKLLAPLADRTRPAAATPARSHRSQSAACGSSMTRRSRMARAAPATGRCASTTWQRTSPPPMRTFSNVGNGS